MVCTQPEQVPVLNRYLPAGVAYLTPLGPPADPSLTDWRDALPRLRAARVQHTLTPAVRQLTPGRRVILVTPVARRPRSAWARAVRRRTREWRAALRATPRLRPIGATSRPDPRRFRSTIRAELFEVVSPTVEIVTERRTPAERFVRDSLEDPRSAGRPFSDRARQTRRSLEHYLKAGIRPRWMERLIEIERGTARHKRRLQDTYDQLREECAHEPVRFRRRWHGIAEAWSFGDLNELIRTHNEWYPVERDLPMDLRTCDYVPINGRSYRRRELDAAWILEQFPPTPQQPG